MTSDLYEKQRALIQKVQGIFERHKRKRRAMALGYDLADSCTRMEALNKLTGNELADAVLEEDWVEEYIFSPQSDFWECVIEKLRRCDRLEEALKYYADRDHWTFYDVWMFSKTIGGGLALDPGVIARNALAAPQEALDAP